MIKDPNDAKQDLPVEGESASRMSLVERPPAAVVPSSVSSRQGVAQPRHLPRPRREPDGKMIEATSYAMHQFGDGRSGSLAVVSSIRGEGRTSVAAAMAFAQARDYGRSTLLIDADFERPDLANKFGVKQSPGVAELIRGVAGLDEVARQAEEGLTVMTAGNIGRSPGRLANEFARSGVLTELQVEFEVVVADLPPLLHSATGPLLAEMFDCRLLVVRAGVTPIARVREAIELLPADPAVMLNGTRSSLPRWVRRFFE